jgi:hypothetical protein
VRLARIMLAAVLHKVGESVRVASLGGPAGRREAEAPTIERAGFGPNVPKARTRGPRRCSPCPRARGSRTFRQTGCLV